jgi:hypothetical protein
MRIAVSWDGEDRIAMPALGCFIPFVTVAVGATLGSYLGDVRGGYWGAAAGLGVGLLIAAAFMVALNRARRGE